MKDMSIILAWLYREKAATWYESICDMYFFVYKYRALAENGITHA